MKPELRWMVFFVLSAALGAGFLGYGIRVKREVDASVPPKIVTPDAAVKMIPDAAVLTAVQQRYAGMSSEQLLAEDKRLDAELAELRQQLGKTTGPPSRSGGKLTEKESEALKVELKYGSDQQEAAEKKLKNWQARDPSAKTIEVEASRLVTQQNAANLRMTLWLRRLADAHRLDAACFVGNVTTDAGRKQCGEKLWAFDGKTGEISLALPAKTAR